MNFQYNAKLAVVVTLALLITFQSDVYGAARRRAVGRPSTGGGGVGLQTPNPTNPLEHNNRGVELGSKGMWNEAVTEHELALSGDPYNLTFRQNLSAAYQRFGQSLMTRKNYSEAIVKLHGSIYVDPENRSADELLSNAIKATGRNPDDAAVRLHMADEYDINGDYVQAIAEYRHYVRMKDSGAAHYGLGRVLVKQGSTVPTKLVEGYAEMRTAVTKPWEPGEKNELSKCHAQLGDILKDLAFMARDSGRVQPALKRMLNAGIEYRRAVTLNPLNSDAIRGLIEVSREAVQVNPSFDNHLTLAAAYQLVPDFEHARREYIECFKLAKNNPAFSQTLSQARRSFHLAVLSSSQSSPVLRAESMQKIEDALRNTPTDAELMFIYGRGKETNGDFEGAKAAYKGAMEINPNINPQLKPRLDALMGNGPARTTATTPGGTAPRGAGSPGTAVAAGVPAQPVAPVKPKLNYTEGESKLRTGDADGAIKFFTAMVDKEPTDGHAWFLLGRADEKKGDLDQASVSYRQATYLKEPEAQDALDQINTSRIQPLLKDYEKAISEKNLVAAASSLKDAIELAPKNSSLHRKLADVLRQMGDAKEADRELKKAENIEKGSK